MLIGLLACVGQGAPPADPRPDVVLILIDTLRADEVEGFGGGPGRTPFLERLGSEGARFDTAWSTSSWTAPSTASVFTSRYPSETGVVEGMMAVKNGRDPFVPRRGG